MSNSAFAAARAFRTRTLSGSESGWEGSRLSSARASASRRRRSRSALPAALLPPRGCDRCQASCLSLCFGLIAANRAARLMAYLSRSRSLRLNLASPAGVEQSGNCTTCHCRPRGVFPPCSPHRPFFIAGLQHGSPSRLRAAPHRGAALSFARFVFAFSRAICRKVGDLRHRSSRPVCDRAPLTAVPPIWSAEVFRLETERRVASRPDVCLIVGHALDIRLMPSLWRYLRKRAARRAASGASRIYYRKLLRCSAFLAPPQITVLFQQRSSLAPPLRHCSARSSAILLRQMISMVCKRRSALLRPYRRHAF